MASISQLYREPSFLLFIMVVAVLGLLGLMFVLPFAVRAKIRAFRATIQVYTDAVALYRQELALHEQTCAALTAPSMEWAALVRKACGWPADETRQVEALRAASVAEDVERWGWPGVGFPRLPWPPETPEIPAAPTAPHLSRKEIDDAVRYARISTAGWGLFLVVLGTVSFIRAGVVTEYGKYLIAGVVFVCWAVGKISGSQIRKCSDVAVAEGSGSDLCA